jgi:outer membrane protein assembly factor BamD
MNVSFNYLSPWILIPLLFLFFAGCSSTPKPADSVTPKEVSSTDEQIFVGDSVEMSYDPNVIMKRAESFFDKESYAEAIVEYKHFLDLHRSHVLAPYAQYKIGVSHFKQYRTVDRDPDPLNQSIQGFNKLLQDFPASRYETEARQTILICKEQLAQRHLMVGQFYLRRGSYLAAAHRFEKVIEEYPELETAGDAMFHLAKTYQDLGVEEWTQDWLITLVNEHPNNPYHSDGQKLLAKLQKENPTLVASLPDSPSANSHPPIKQSPVDNTPSVQESPLFSYAGVLPTAAVPAPMPVQTASTTSPSHTSCRIGTWCESGSAPVTVSASQTSNSPKACKTGEWC